MNFLKTLMHPNQFTLILISILLGILLISCEEPDDNDDDNANDGSSAYYVLCEGTFTHANASLWSYDESSDSTSGPHIWDTDTNPLGDIGQSMALNGQLLYLVMNNSHDIKIVDLENGPEHIGDISIPNSSPRYMAVQATKDRAFVSSWNQAGLLVLDLNTNTITDTIALGGLPEQLIVDGDRLFVSINSDVNWNQLNQVLQLDISLDQPTVSSSYTVLDGPGSMALEGNYLYVSSLAYDPSTWAAETGTSRIDLTTGAVLTANHGVYQNYTADIDVYNGVPYRVYGNSIVPLNSDLSFNLAGSIANLSGIYSFSIQNDKFLIGTSDYTAPDPVYIYSATGDSLSSFNVAAFPGEVIYYNSDNSDTE